MKIPLQKRIYALYKGEQFIAVGTIREINEATGKSIKFLGYMTRSFYNTRYVTDNNNRLRMMLLDNE